MAQSAPSIDLPCWLRTPPARYLLEWEQSQLDLQVADVFGFHAVQLGLAELEGLRANRMPHRWLIQPALLSGADSAVQPSEGADGQAPQGPRNVAVCCDFDALPFATQSLDLVVLPHTLELARDPHQTLREVDRVLVPEGRVVILGFNPRSLWGARQWAGRCALRLGAAPEGGALFLPQAGELIAPRRLRDWLRLLSFEVDRGSFGCYRPPLRSQAWLERLAWVEQAGDRWWPALGAVYAFSAVKRVRGMRLIEPAWRKAQKTRRTPAVVSQRQRAPAPQPAESLESLEQRKSAP
jgi:SAM-dependent methyltransferase